jgi:hypothetical protein
MFKKSTIRVISAMFGLLVLIGITPAPAQAALNLGTSSLYIVKVTPSARAAVETAVKNAGGTIEAKYQYAFDGYVIKLPDMLATRRAFGGVYLFKLQG